MARPSLLLRTLWLTAPAALLAVAAVAETAITESAGVLYSIDPDTGVVEALGPTGVGGTFGDLAFSPRGRLFGIGTTTTTKAALFELDPTEGAASLVGELGFESLTAFAVDGEGRFWASDGEQLFTIDAATGQATAGPLLDQPIAALASHGDRLFAVSYLGEYDASVFEVETTTGQLIPILQGAPVELPISDATFDSEGQLRLKTVFGGSLLGADHALVRIDLETGITETTHEFFTVFTDPLSRVFALAMRGTPPPIDIPTLGPSAILILVLLLAGLGVMVMSGRLPSR